MTKYMVFGWSDNSGKGPADSFLGTTDELADEFESQPESGELEGTTHFGFKKIRQAVTLDKNLMGGKTWDMETFVSYALWQGVGKGRISLAYLPILTREQYIEQGYLDG